MSDIPISIPISVDSDGTDWNELRPWQMGVPIEDLTDEEAERFVDEVLSESRARRKRAEEWKHAGKGGGRASIGGDTGS